ncbi:hypothetical protein [Deinococcus aluminii]|uniref:Uncharacterized protein n=1 Tax=Deinococcus aluminii TaxID=1656885 RepID=A0ABP9XEQ1_9DEIO
MTIQGKDMQTTDPREQISGVDCLTREELQAGRPVTRQVSFAPEYLGTASDAEVTGRIVGWMRPVVEPLGRWQARQARLRRTGKLDDCGNEIVTLTFTPWPED